MRIWDIMFTTVQRTLDCMCRKSVKHAQRVLSTYTSAMRWLGFLHETFHV